MRVLIADDQEMLREVLEAILTRAEMTVTLAHDLDHALAEIANCDPFDLILLDYHMPGMDGLDGVRRTMANGKGARVALMSGNLPHHVVRDALSSGAAGFLPKKLAAKSYIEAVRAMVSGQQVNLLDSDPDQPRKASASMSEQRLTSRELLVLKQLDSGKSVEQIASDLGLKELTVNFIVKTLCRKFEAQDHAETVAIARKEGVL